MLAALSSLKHISSQPALLLLAVLAFVGHSLSADDKPSPKPSGTAKKPATSAATSPVLVVVNGQSITEADLERVLKTRQVPAAMRAKARDVFLQELVDTRLIQQYLASRDTAASEKDIDAQVERVLQLAKSEGDDPEKRLVEMGYTRASLRAEFAVPLAWQKHLDRVATPKKVQEYFEFHRAEFDGTKVRASHILIKVPSDASDDERKAAFEKLEQIRSQIVSRKLAFAEAAEKYSQAPSSEQGGDVGLIPFSGKMPSAFSKVAFGLKEGEVSQPITTPVGVHLCLVTERLPGDLSLEDVRSEVVTKYSQELWRKTADDLKAKAKIEWKAAKSSPPK